jgi:hypothetical protein
MTEAHDNRIPDRLARTMPLLVAAVALPTFVAFWIGGRPELGLLWGAISLACGALLAAAGRRSDTLRIVQGVDDDERARLLEYQSMTAVALVLTVTLTGLFLTEGIRGESGIVYGVLLILAEATHVAALALLNRRG